VDSNNKNNFFVCVYYLWLASTLDRNPTVVENLRVSKELKESLAEIAYQIQEQLKFYRELGLSDIGGASLGAEMASVASFKPSLITGDLAVAGIAEERAGNTTEKTVRVEETSSAPANKPADLPISAPLLQTSAEQSFEPPKSLAVNQAQDETMSKKKDDLPQAGLFGEITREPTSSSRNSLPVLSLLPQDRSLEDIRADIGDCTRCKLHAGRTKIVFGEGNPQARLMFVGEGPGADEDVTGRPFVGRAGQLLDKIIAAIGYKRQEVYIGNVVKCRPPGNRTPERDEVDTCEQFLFRQIALIKPKVIVALGSPAFQCLFRTKESITRARGQLREWNGIQVMPTFHPAYLLRSPDKKREAWEDMKIVRDYLNSISD
jgi:uracil-DNA glycosylase family 4